MAAAHAMPYRACTTLDLFVLKGEAPEGLLEASDLYLSAFVAPERDAEGRTRCFHCGGVVDGFRQAMGLAVAYVWDLTHGEARCSGCGWPARGIHRVKDKDGSELYSLRNFFLAYHPDVVTDASVDRSPEGGDPQGLHAEHESAVRDSGDAP